MARLAIFAAIVLMAAASANARFAPAEGAATGRSLLQSIDCGRIANWCVVVLVFFCVLCHPRRLDDSRVDREQCALLVARSSAHTSYPALHNTTFPTQTRTTHPLTSQNTHHHHNTKNKQRHRRLPQPARRRRDRPAVHDLLALVQAQRRLLCLPLRARLQALGPFLRRLRHRLVVRGRCRRPGRRRRGRCVH